MFSEPITITINGVAQVMPRIETVGRRSLYQKPDGTFNLIIDHTTTKKAGRNRHVVRLEERAIVVNPLDTTNDYDTAAVTHIIECPEYGFTMARLDQLVQGFKAWYVTAVVDKLTGGES